MILLGSGGLKCRDYTLFTLLLIIIIIMIAILMKCDKETFRTQKLRRLVEYNKTV